VLTHLLVLLSKHGWLIICHGIYIVSQCIYNLSLANHPRYFAIILIVTVREGTEVPGIKDRSIGRVLKELDYGKVETSRDAEEAARWWRND